MAVDLQAKQEAIAKTIDGRVVDDRSRVAVCIKGVVLGFPATLEAILPGWPFGVSYAIETNPVVNPSQQEESYKDYARISICPRVGRGLAGIFTRIVLFESRGQSIGDKKLESKFIFSYDDREVAERFCRYPSVSERLQSLQHISKFTEMVVKTDAGIYLSQPVSFNSLDPDVCRETFRELGELGQVLFDAF